MENTLDKSIQRIILDFQEIWKSSWANTILAIPPNHYRLNIKKNIRFSRISARCMLICAILLRLPSEAVFNVRFAFASQNPSRFYPAFFIVLYKKFKRKEQ